ncbi:MAG: biotin/lipoyl-binding protein, partial [Sulfuriferula sp.]
MRIAALIIGTLLTATSALAVEVPLTTPVSGVVKTVPVTQGQSVKQGQVLLTLDDSIYQAHVAEAAASMSRLQAEMVEADKDLKRAKELY